VSAVLKLSSRATREFWGIPVLFEDEPLLALDKPAGLLTSPDRYDPLRPNLTKLLHAGIADRKPGRANASSLTSPTRTGLISRPAA
jgi:23S rRNA-/tRNA-specific pseudouridylate synthase